MGLNSGRSDLNCKTRVLEFFFVLVDFLQTTSGNLDHKHLNLGRSDLNCNTRVLESWFVLADVLQRTSRILDHKHCTLGWSNRNFISMAINLTVSGAI